MKRISEYNKKYFYLEECWNNLDKNLSGGLYRMAFKIEGMDGIEMDKSWALFKHSSTVSWIMDSGIRVVHIAKGQMFVKNSKLFVEQMMHGFKWQWIHGRIRSCGITLMFVLTRLALLKMADIFKDEADARKAEQIRHESMQMASETRRELQEGEAAS